MAARASHGDAKGKVDVAAGPTKLYGAVEARDIIVALQRRGITQVVIAEATDTNARSVHAWKAGANPRRQKYDRLAALRDVVTALNDSLTDKGVAQWLTARNRYLKGRRPVDVLAQGRTDEVLEAANAFAEGIYL